MLWKNKGFGLDQARERLLDQVFAARSLEEITQAKQALRAWLLEHPEESGMRDGFEWLSHRQDFAQERDAEQPYPSRETVPREPVSAVVS